ncbi:TetR/AcrR family transcriptional regulator [Aeromicrobium sp. CTD01-1L150]|uniref:TetR/AcrR family transcriptional regulator n=1 Tax=Aeromicrobium sp. CTD01-1L150 TaxID=3341830 RepID=UPI0035C150EE
MPEENPLSASLRLLWEGLPKTRKGPKATLTLEQIVSTGIELADAEGIDALTMRKLAAALGMGTMSLYRYVPSKTELLNLMLDHVSGAQVGRLSPGSGWRETLETAGRQGRALYLDHPWLMGVNWSRPVLGPGSVAGMEETMAGLRGLPFSDQEKVVVISALDAYVTGLVRQEILYTSAAAETGMSDEEFWSAQLPTLVAAMESGQFPVMASLDEDCFDASWDQTFELGLSYMLDGIDREVERRA